MHDKTMTELSAGLANGEFSAVELTQAFLARIRTHNERLNAFVDVTEDCALAQAQQSDAKRAAGGATPLTGIPVAHKDLFCTTAGTSTACSRILSGYRSPYNATMVQKLEDAGMVMLGKTNMDEFAMGCSNETSSYGACKNPWRLDCVPGGSSGGSAAAVAAGLTPAATGSDTGGSIRQPAALTGITGIKPTYGRISRYGMIAFASSLDQAGPMTRSAEGAALMLQAMSGFDRRDSTSANRLVEDYRATLAQSIEGVKIGLPVEFFAGLDNRMAERVMAAARVLEGLGATLHEVSLPQIKLAVPTYYVITPAEASSNLARYDGVRYGYRCSNPKDVQDLYRRTRGEGFGQEVKRRIMIGTYVLSAGAYETYYMQAQKVRRLIARDFAAAFEEVDVLMGSTTANPAFQLNAKLDDEIAMCLEDIYTSAVNLAGLPAMSVPCGQVDGLPVGLHLVSRHFDETRLLNIGYRYQQETDWHRQRPAEFA